MMEEVDMRFCATWIAVLLVAILAGCAPEVGSDAWCEDMKAKPKKDWSASELKDYSKHCLFK